MKRGCLIGVTLCLAGCGGPQSVLDPAGRDAEVLANLFWVMLAGAVVLWLLINGLIHYVTRIAPRPLGKRHAETLIIGGGVVFPTVVLAALLTYALSEMPSQRALGEGLTVHITGHQFWWRVEYLPDGAEEPVVSANEIRLPTGSRSELQLDADRVIHSFWIPALGGKTDMIPGRRTRMSLEPTLPGTYRGQCTEFCGDGHAFMAFGAVVMTPEDFSAWLEAEAAPAMPPESAEARRGAAAFLSEGCGGCHAVRGTVAAAQVGPDLTHLAARSTLAAGILPMERAAIREWIAAPEDFKPGVEMPGYDHLPPEDLDALAAYLMGLR
ncbi:cytochrome c oxidase subunit II [Algicella marina]|uniref:C-type cytochrome n=1 Tax=Algicella marina TaxID=2683284 RepID=A0A6P1SYN2_9RHOB|nr:cytochrome c oxidase subunit II [Algicella marina]QHQ35794.1 c-type cytochrome [Algicella marina]